jgi:hypothetical protein
MTQKDTKRRETRTIFRPNFGNCAELPLYERWFSDMAAQGKHLLSWGTWFCRFAERNPKQMFYRIDLREKIPGSQRTAPAHDGWNFVCRRDDAFVYRAELNAIPDGTENAETSAPPDFLFDPRRRFASLKAQQKSVTALAVLLCAAGLLVTLFGLLSFSWHSFLSGEYGYFCAAVLFFACAFILAIEAFRLHHIHYRYKTRQEESRPNWHASQWRSYGTAAACIALLLLSIIPLVVQGVFADARTLPFQPSDTGAPLPWLENIDGVLARVPAQNPPVQYDTNNFIAQKWSLFAPEQYSSRQCGESEDAAYHPIVQSELIKCSYSFMAVELFEECAVTPKGWEQVFAVEGGGQADQLRLFCNEYGEYKLAARKGKAVLTVEYHGAAGQAKLLDAANAVLASV